MFTQPFIRAQIKETSKLRVTGLCAGNSPVPGEFPAQMPSNAENVSIWWRHHDGTPYPALRVLGCLWYSDIIDLCNRESEQYYYVWNIVSSHGTARYRIIYQEHLATCYCFVRTVYTQLITTCGNTLWLRLNVLVFIRHAVYEFGSYYCISVHNSFQLRGWRGGTFHLIGWAMVTVWLLIATTSTKWLLKYTQLDARSNTNDIYIDTFMYMKKACIQMVTECVCLWNIG